MRRRRTRPAVLAAALVLTSLAAGILYAVLTGANSSGVEENNQTIAAAGVYPGARKLGGGSNAVFPENGLPVPRGIVTTVAYRPPAGATQVEVVDFYLSRLHGRWTPIVERSLAGPGNERSYRVTFSRDDRCVVLTTAGLLLSADDERAYALSAYPADNGQC